MSLSPLASEILVRRQAQLDAPWRPLRWKHQEWSNPGAIYIARQESYVGQSLHQGIASGADRQRFFRANTSLVKAGLMERGSAGKSRLTAEGERVARALAWCYGVDDIREALHRLAVLTEAGHHLGTDPPGYSKGPGFVPEVFIAGTAWGEQCDLTALKMLGHCLLPALRAGLVESASSNRGHVFYRLADKAVSDSQLAELIDASLSESFDEKLADMWFDQMDATRDHVLKMDPGGCIGFISLHVGMIRSSRDYSDMSGIPPLFPKPEPAALAG